jgi:hypothetical protein
MKTGSFLGSIQRYFFDLASLCDQIGLPIAAARETLARLGGSR